MEEAARPRRRFFGLFSSSSRRAPRGNAADTQDVEMREVRTHGTPQQSEDIAALLQRYSQVLEHSRQLPPNTPQTLTIPIRLVRPGSSDHTRGSTATSRSRRRSGHHHHSHHSHHHGHNRSSALRSALERMDSINHGEGEGEDGEEESEGDPEYEDGQTITASAILTTHPPSAFPHSARSSDSSTSSGASWPWLQQERSTSFPSDSPHRSPTPSAQEQRSAGAAAEHPQRRSAWSRFRSLFSRGSRTTSAVRDVSREGPVGGAAASSQSSGSAHASASSAPLPPLQPASAFGGEEREPVRVPTVLSPWDSFREEVRNGPPPQASGASFLANAIERFRDELLEAIALAVLDQHETTAAKNELTRLERMQEVESLRKSVQELEVEYDSALASPSTSSSPSTSRMPGKPLLFTGSQFTESQVRSIETRLVVTRVLLSIAEVGTNLMALRQHEGESSAALTTAEENLNSNLRLLASCTDGGADMERMILRERERAQLRKSPAAEQGGDVSAGFQSKERRGPSGNSSSPSQRETKMTAAGGYQDEGSFGAEDGGLEEDMDAARAFEALASSLAYRIRYQRQRIRFIGLRSGGKVELSLRRADLYSDSRSALLSMTRQLKRRLYVKYEGEEGKDYGGLARDWFVQMASELVERAVKQGLFVEQREGSLSFIEFSPYFTAFSKHLSECEVLGRLVGLGIFHGKVLNVLLSPPIWKAALGKPIKLEDIKLVDPTLYKSLTFLLEMENAEDLDLTFTTSAKVSDQSLEKGEEETSVPAKTRTFPLKENGDQIVVNDDNKHEYVNLLLDFRYGSRIRDQVRSFVRGMCKFIALEDLKDFDEFELALMVCGLQQIDISDWREHTKYENGYNAESQAVVWFWEIVSSFSHSQQQKLLKFVTGSSNLPILGFQSLPGTQGSNPFCIYRNAATESLPVGHTCINRLDLPPYQSKTMMRDKLLYAIEETDGFGVV